MQGVLVAGVLALVGGGYLAFKSGPTDYKVAVKNIPVGDIPLCDENRTVKPCAATKVDWDKLEVQVAAGVTRTVVGTAFLPNAKE